MTVIPIRRRTRGTGRPGIPAVDVQAAELQAVLANPNLCAYHADARAALEQLTAPQTTDQAA